MEHERNLVKAYRISADIACRRGLEDGRRYSSEDIFDEGIVDLKREIATMVGGYPLILSPLGTLTPSSIKIFYHILIHQQLLEIMKHRLKTSAAVKTVLSPSAMDKLLLNLHLDFAYTSKSFPPVL
jgi:hypothetical protein